MVMDTTCEATAAPAKSGLIRLGRCDDFKPLLTRGTFPLLIEAP